jgi:DUF971 family protein
MAFRYNPSHQERHNEEWKCMNVRPVNITLNKTEAYLEIAWSDDTVCQYPLSHLREACPCVECRGGHQFMGLEHAPDNLLQLKPARTYTMSALHPVGNYAVQPVWDDGHDTGIYTWEYLRHLCP